MLLLLSAKQTWPGLAQEHARFTGDHQIGLIWNGGIIFQIQEQTIQFENFHETPTFQTEPTAQRLITTPLAFEIEIGMINHKQGKDFFERD